MDNQNIEMYSQQQFDTIFNSFPTCPTTKDFLKKLPAKDTIQKKTTRKQLFSRAYVHSCLQKTCFHTIRKESLQ